MKNNSTWKSRKHDHITTYNMLICGVSYCSSYCSYCQDHKHMEGPDASQPLAAPTPTAVGIAVAVASTIQPVAAAPRCRRQFVRFGPPSPCDQ